MAYLIFSVLKGLGLLAACTPDMETEDILCIEDALAEFPFYPLVAIMNDSAANMARERNLADYGPVWRVVYHAGADVHMVCHAYDMECLALVRKGEILGA